MKVLAVECSSNTASAALTDDRKLIGVYTKNAGKTHSEILLPMVDELLRSYSLKISDIDLFSCSIGPGSFTGIRIGVSMIKGLAFSTGKPCVGVSSLESLAYGFNAFPSDFIVCPALDARRGNVYNALFSVSEASMPRRLCDDRIISASALADELQAISKKIIICGDGADVINKAISEYPGKYTNITNAPPSLHWPSAFCVAQCAFNEFEKGRAVSDKELAPIYLRPTQAERELCGEKD